MLVDEKKKSGQRVFVAAARRPQPRREMSERLDNGEMTAYSGPVEAWCEHEFSSQMSCCKDKDDTVSEASEGSEDHVTSLFSLSDQLTVIDLRARLKSKRDRRRTARTQSKRISKVSLPPGVIAALKQHVTK